MSLLELDGTDLKFMISILYKMRLNKRIENVEFVVSDIKGISKRAFFNSIESLTTKLYLKVCKVNKTTYAISLNMESKHFTEQDIEHLTRPFKNALPDMTMQIAQKSASQAEIKPLDIATVFGVRKTETPTLENSTKMDLPNKTELTLDRSKSDIKFKSDTKEDAYYKMWGGS